MILQPNRNNEQNMKNPGYVITTQPGLKQQNTIQNG